MVPIDIELDSGVEVASGVCCHPWTLYHMNLMSQHGLLQRVALGHDSVAEQ